MGEHTSNMAKITLSNLSKGTKLTLSNESKASDMTWDEADMTWDEQEGTWAQPELALSLESKSEIDLSLETK